MSWGSGGYYFGVVAKALVDHDASDDLKVSVCTVLIRALRDGDWGTCEESLREFAGDPAIVEAFRRNGIAIRCHAEDRDDERWYECELERGHVEDHDDKHGRTWPRAESGAR